MDTARTSNVYSPKDTKETVVPPDPSSWHAVDHSVEERENTISFEAASVKYTLISEPDNGHIVGDSVEK